MDYQIKEFSKIGKYSNITSLGARIRKIHIYKYMSVKTAVACLNNNSLWFKIPITWPDPYESRFYDADYHLVEKMKFNKKMYACCVSKNKLSESAWRMYSDYPKEHCVKFTICIGQFRHYLNQFASANNASIYEGEVQYTLTDDEINNLHLHSSPFFRDFFHNFRIEEYLNLMLIKRQLFNYEGEIRYMLMGDFDYDNDHISIEIPWSMCLSKISLNEKDFTIEDENILETALCANIEMCKKKFALTYTPSISIEKENIYRKFKRIIVGK